MKGTVTILMAAVLMPAAAVAQEWRTYNYADPNPGFTIQFPAAPEVQKSTVKNSTGVSLPITRYVVRAEHIIYTLSIVDYSRTNADSLSTIAETERSLGISGKVTAANGARIRRNFGRALNLSSPDGSHSAIAIFFVNKHLYTVAGQALPPNVSDGLDDASRFQQSLDFLDDDIGFGIHFGAASPARPKVADAPPAVAVSATRTKGISTAPADATCTGKSAGDAVQLQTPRGPVAATCTLVARPNAPPDEKP